MTLDYAAAETLYRAGRYSEIAADCRGDNSTLLKIQPLEHRALLGEVLLWSGHFEGARSLAVSVQRDAGTGRAALARAEYVLGLVSREVGEFDQSVQRLHLASRLASDAQDLPLAALASMMWLRAMAERHTPAVTKNTLADVRRLVTRAAEPSLTAFLHECVARQEAQAGNMDEAKRHLKVAGSLLARFPNALVQEHCAINAFCTSWLECDFESGEAHLRRARSFEQQTGSLDLVIANNEGHLFLQRGKFAQAEERLRRVVQNSRGLTRSGALEGLARVFLASGDLAQCDDALRELHESHTDDDLTKSFNLRWSIITKVRLLLRRSELDGAIEWAERAVTMASLVDDRQLIAVASLLQAVALHRARRDDQCTRLMWQAIRHDIWSFRQHAGLVMQACFEIFGATHRGLAKITADRLRRLWKDQGNVAAEMEFRATHTDQVMEDRGSRWSAASNNGTSVVDVIASIFDVAHSPSLLSSELVKLGEIVRGSHSIRTVGGRLADNVGLEESDGLILQLGVHRGQQVAIRCDSPSSPVDAIALAAVLRIARAALELERFRQEERNRAALWPADSIETEAGALFVAEEMQALLATARRVATANVPVRITGETGTGKEVLARLVHAYSPRAKAPFLPFNCTATPKDMLDSQLFGHRRGSFTGAIDHFPGVIRAAAGGTLFLDEIGETTLDVQPKLLRFLESGDVHPIGETQPVRVDVRVIAATNADLDALVANGRFREDLFYRLNIIRLHLPPLRERRVEIPSLAHHYLHKYAQENHKGDLRLAEETMEYLVLYRWPGNIRQLANEMRRLAALSEPGAVLMPEHLSRDIAASRRTVAPSERALDPTEVVVRLDQPMAAGIHHLERAMILYALKMCGGRMEETAAMLGLSRKGLYLKRQRYAVDAHEHAAEVA